MMMKRFRFAGLVLWLTLPRMVLGNPIAEGGPGASRPNIVLIMLDDVGAESFGPYGSTQYRTPNIDRLAAQGMTFDHCYSQPLCTPSRVQIMTGKSNVRNYVSFDFLDKSQTTFAHLLRDAGYRTLIAGKWQLMGGNYTAPALVGKGSTPEEAGFDDVACWQAARQTPRYWEPTLEMGGTGEFQSFGADDYGPDVLNRYLRNFIREQTTDQPFLIYYPMMLPHDPFVPTPDSEDRNSEDEQKNFEDMVAYADKLIGKLVDTIDEQGLGENTLILFTSDNGAHRVIRSVLGDQVIEGRKGRAEVWGTHVPLVARWTGRIEAGQRSDDLIDFSDFLPTLCEAAGADIPEDIDGQSFLWRLTGQEGSPKEAVYIFYQLVMKGRRGNPAIFARNHRYALYADGRLYDVQMDPSQAQPLETLDEEARAARDVLQRVIDSYPSEGEMILKPSELSRSVETNP